MDTTSLADLDVDTLATRLIAVAQRARKLASEGDPVKLHDLLEEVRQATGTARGNHLALLEVAEAFLRAMARSDLGRSELALRRFFAEHHEEAEGIFARLLKPSEIGEDELRTMAGGAGPQVTTLIGLGVLRRVGNKLDLRPSLRPLARDLLEPAALRMWRRVNDARAQIGWAHMEAPEAGAYLSAQLGITQAQGASHLTAHPLIPPRSSAPGPAGQARVQGSPNTSQTRTRYQRDLLSSTAPQMAPGPMIASPLRSQQVAPPLAGRGHSQSIQAVPAREYQ